MALLTGIVAAIALQEAAPDSVLRLVDLPGLARLDPDVVCREFASTDPSGHGDDHGHFLRLEGKRAVLAEMDGPGVIARLWSANASGQIKVYFDGEEAPRIDAPFQDLFTGKYPPFVEPIATHQGGGWISYFPIPYAKHCRVEVDELDDPGALYYQVQYLTWPKRTPIHSFTRDLSREERWSLRRVVDLWKSLPTAPPTSDAKALLDMDEVQGRFFFELGTVNRKTASGGVKVEAGATTPAFQAKRGPGLLRFLGVELPDPSPGALRGLILEVTVDGAKGPSISAPIADLFGIGFGAKPWTGLLAGGTEHGGFLRLPIYWKREATITLRNLTGLPIVATLTASQVGPESLAPDVAYLHAEYRRVDQVGSDLYEFANVNGPGKFVGVNLTLQGVGDLWYLEGNEQLFVDGEAQPSIVGTGTEDFFNGGWYWDSGPLALPLNGLGVKEEWTTNRTTPWRHFLPDAVPFRTGFVGRIEHGSANQVLDACYTSVAFWYADVPAPVHRVAAEETRMPALWVRRPKGALPAVAMNWSPATALEKKKWEELSSEWRGCEYPLYQGFPVSHFERDQPKVPSELARLHGREVRAAFTVDEGDRYRLRLQYAKHSGAPKLRILVDEHEIGQLAPGEGLASGEGAPEAIAPATSPDLGPIGLAKGQHFLSLVEDGRAATESWTGLDCVVLDSAAPFVKTWWVAPPAGSEPGKTVEEEPPLEQPFLAADFDPAAAGWTEVPDAGDVADLNHWVSSRAPMVGYLATWVQSPDDRVARVRLGSDDGVRVWCNGTLAWSHSLHRPITVDADRFDVTLHAGWNLILVKVRNDDGGYALSLRICDPDALLKVATRKE